MVVDAIKHGSAPAYGVVLHEISLSIRSFIIGSIISCTISHESRTSNAHAKHALVLGTSRHVWLGVPEELRFFPVIVMFK